MNDHDLVNLTPLPVYISRSSGIYIWPISGLAQLLNLNWKKHEIFDAGTAQKKTCLLPLPAGE